MAPSKRDFGPLRSDDEMTAMCRLLAAAFPADEDGIRGWLTPSREHVRVLRRDGEVVGGLLFIPMGQHFGGKRLAMTGVAGVAVAPALRGQGVATTLMSHAMRELAASGAPLSALYPATHTLYRRAGYDLAGGHYEISVPAGKLDIIDRSLAVRPLGDDDDAIMERLYRAYAQTRQGYLDRGPYVWNRVRSPRAGRAEGYLVLGPERPEGYVLYAKKEGDHGDYALHLIDLVSTTARAARRALGFLADHRSMATGVRWTGGPDDPHIAILPERGVAVRLIENWMLRLVDVRAALAGRGYPRGLTARLELEVSDPVLPDNNGRFILDVAGGEARVKRGGRGRLALTIGGLATLYSGHLGAEQLALTGAASGTPNTLDVASQLFAYRTPSLPDFF